MQRNEGIEPSLRRPACARPRARSVLLPLLLPATTCYYLLLPAQVVRQLASGPANPGDGLKLKGLHCETWWMKNAKRPGVLAEHPGLAARPCGLPGRTGPARLGIAPSDVLRVVVADQAGCDGLRMTVAILPRCAVRLSSEALLGAQRQAGRAALGSHLGVRPCVHWVSLGSCCVVRGMYSHTGKLKKQAHIENNLH
jgi:hypothetical protein